MYILTVTWAKGQMRLTGPFSKEHLALAFFDAEVRRKGVPISATLYEKQCGSYHFSAVLHYVEGEWK
jgi:hypothetical protein